MSHRAAKFGWLSVVSMALSGAVTLLVGLVTASWWLTLSEGEDPFGPAHIGAFAAFVAVAAFVLAVAALAWVKCRS